jgi:Trp operon repressor
VNKEQNKIARYICLILSPIFLLVGITQGSFLYGFVIPSLLVSIFLYLKKSSINIELTNLVSAIQSTDVNALKNSINKKADDLVLGAALITMREITNDYSAGIGKYYEEEQKDKLIYDCLIDIEKTLFEQDKIKAVRLRLMNLMFSCAEMDVLLMKPPTIHNLLSGEMSEKIIELLNVNESLNQKITSEITAPLTLELAESEISDIYLQRHFYMAAYNTVRISLKDFSNDLKKDWYRCCYISFCIWMEDTYRSQLDMPKLIENQMKAIAFSGWVSVANENPIDLRESFESKWNNIFNEPSPFFEIEV